MRPLVAIISLIGGAVAQLGERLLCTEEVRGSSPLSSTRDAFSVHAMEVDDSGDALRLLQEHLGHASFNTTAKYRKVAGEEHRNWYEGLWRDGLSDSTPRLYRQPESFRRGTKSVLLADQFFN